MALDCRAKDNVRAKNGWVDWRLCPLSNTRAGYFLLKRRSPNGCKLNSFPHSNLPKPTHTFRTNYNSTAATSKPRSPGRFNLAARVVCRKGPQPHATDLYCRTSQIRIAYPPPTFSPPRFCKAIGPIGVRNKACSRYGLPRLLGQSSTPRARCTMTTPSKTCTKVPSLTSSFWFLVEFERQNPSCHKR
jgi:hypothetical protein